MQGEGSGNKNVTEKASVSVMFGSCCIKDRGCGRGGEPSLSGFCFCFLRFSFSFSLCVFVVCIHAYGAHRDHKRESEAPSEPPNKNAGNWTRVLLTTEPWLQSSPFSNIYLILCVFRDTIIFLIICALLNVCDKKSVLCPQPMLPAPPCSTGREISQATERKPLQNMNSGWLKSSFINRSL